MDRRLAKIFYISCSGMRSESIRPSALQVLQLLTIYEHHPRWGDIIVCKSSFCKHDRGHSLQTIWLSDGNNVYPIAPYGEHREMMIPIQFAVLEATVELSHPLKVWEHLSYFSCAPYDASYASYARWLKVSPVIEELTQNVQVSSANNVFMYNVLHTNYNRNGRFVMLVVDYKFGDHQKLHELSSVLQAFKKFLLQSGTHLLTHTDPVQLLDKLTLFPRKCADCRESVSSRGVRSHILFLSGRHSSEDEANEIPSL